MTDRRLKSELTNSQAFYFVSFCFVGKKIILDKLFMLWWSLGWFSFHLILKNLVKWVTAAAKNFLRTFVKNIINKFIWNYYKEGLWLFTLVIDEM
jgi:hypothetical protein